MNFFFWKKKTLAKSVGENKRMVDRSYREIDRERQKLQTQEKRLIIEMKRIAKQGQIGAVKIMAKDLVRIRKRIQGLYSIKTQLRALSLRIQTMKSTDIMGESMAAVTRAMREMNSQMNIPQLQNMMQEFEKQSDRMDVTMEVMGGAIDDAMEGDGEQEETEEVVNQVLDEIGIHVSSQLVNVPKKPSVTKPLGLQEVNVAETSASDADDPGTR